MPLINCKVELKLKWTKYCVLSAAGADNANTDSNKIIFTLKNTELYVPVVTLYKTISKNKNTTNEYRYFLQSNFVGINRLFVLVYTNHDANAKIVNARKYYLPKGIIRNHNFIINGKNFYDKPINSDIKRYEEIKKLTTGQGEDYTTGCLLDYDYVKNNYRLIAVDLSRQKKLDADPEAI